MPGCYVAFWNIENLFDVDGSPERPEWLQSALARELAGWNAEVLALKIGQLARIIRQMNGGAVRTCSASAKSRTSTSCACGSMPLR